MFRVTERSIATNILGGLQGNLSRLGDTQQRLSSGKQITKPSDSPTGTVAAMQFRSEMAVSQQYSRNANDGVGWLSTADTALSSTATLLDRARDLVLQGMTAGPGGSDDARAALATEVDNLRTQAIGLGNTTYLGRPVFGGTTAGKAAFDSNGGFIGDKGLVNRTVGSSLKVRVDTDADVAFGSGNTQLFKVLGDVADDLRSNPTALQADLDRIDQAAGALHAAQSSVGARYNQLTQARQAADDKVLDLTSQLSDVEDIDLPKTLTDMQLQQTAYQAALAAAGKVVQPSLVDFLR
jgi:flagellar hook-associated protein 3 FlgL